MMDKNKHDYSEFGGILKKLKDAKDNGDILKYGMEYLKEHNYPEFTDEMRADMAEYVSKKVIGTDTESDKYFTYEQAEQLMLKGHTTSVGSGSYDYYVISKGTLYGQYSVDDELYELSFEERLKIFCDNMWYLIS